MNEADFVAYLRETFPFACGTGIGDDTSVVKVVKDQDGHQLITTDLLIEDVHFKLPFFTMEELALKALAVNLSDIAAMGGQPLYFYLGLGFPKTLPREALMEFFKGIETGCRKWQVQLAGGDFSSSPVMVISITMVGKVSNPVYRHNARVHDLVGITGPIGESAIGLQLLLNGHRQGYFIDKHKIVHPEIEAGQILSLYAHAMIDVSDGLVIDLNRILTASQKGARLAYEKLPVSRELKEICRENRWNEYDMVLAGGEDYVLLFTLSAQNLAKLRQEHPHLNYAIIGEIVEDPATFLVEHEGKPVQLTRTGYDHFAPK